MSNNEIITMTFNEQNNKYNYLDIVNFLIEGNRTKLDNPRMSIHCLINKKIIKEDKSLYRILSSIYDKVELCDDIKNKDIRGGRKKDIFSEQHYYDHELIKQILGPMTTLHTMFTEKEIEMKQDYGFINNARELQRISHAKNDEMIDKICKIFSVIHDKVKKHHVKYYYTRTNTEFRLFKLNAMLDNIKEYDYFRPTKFLASYNAKNNYYERITKKYENLFKTINVKKLSDYDIPEKDRDLIMLNYIKCRKKCFVMTVWKPALPGIDKFIAHLENDGNVYYIKTIKFTYNALKNLMFAYYDEFTFEERLIFIEKKLKYINTSKKELNTVKFIFFDNINNKHLAGQGSRHKKILRRKLLEFANLDAEKYRGNDLLHVNDYFYQTINYSKILLNENSLRLLDNQNSTNFIRSNMTIPNLLLQTFKKIINYNMSLLETDRLIIMGSVILYAYGIRPFGDIDSLLILGRDKCNRLTNTVNYFFMDKKTKFHFSDVGIPDSKYWKEKWTNKNNKIADYYNKEDINELILDPDYYMYFQGIKMFTLDIELLKKIMRNRTEDHVDFIMISLLCPKVISDHVRLNKTFADSKYIKNTKIDKNNLDSDFLKSGPLFLISNKYRSVVGEFTEFKNINLKDKIKILKRRYVDDEINKVKDRKVFKAYFS